MTHETVTDRPTGDENGGCWEAFIADPTPEHREVLVERYLKLLYRNAATLARRIPSLERGEAISAGYIGLSQAIDRFQPSRGLSFTTFACPRIRGAVLDEVRRQSPLPRPAHERRRTLDRAARTVASRNLRRPDGPEVAAELGVPVAQYWAWRDDGLRGQDVSLNQSTGRLSSESSRTPGDVIPDPDAHGFIDRVERESTREEVRNAVARLPRRERVAIEAHFFEEKPHREVGAMLGVSGTRACEIVQRGVVMLRAFLGGGAEPQPA